MLKYLAACLTAALLLLGAQGPAAAEKRVALVIGYIAEIAPHSPIFAPESAGLSQLLKERPFLV